MNEKRQQLISKGVQMPNPECVDIGDDIEPNRISATGVTLYAGCKLYGKETYIAEDAQIGYEGPTTIENCYIGPRVALKCGFFRDAAFLEGARCGWGAHIREGTILEEKASVAHSVGLKQTILFPYVTLGSLINFCDCLMAGGSGPKNHSEVGSSYIHFNFTPNQDKATPSLIGDVPRGVMLNQSPIFLGGQGGLVGPCRIAYGTVIAAGSICRKDQLIENQLVIEGHARAGKLPYQAGVYRNIRRLLFNNIYYIGNLFALQQWYLQIRALFVGDKFPKALFIGLIGTLEKGIAERMHQLNQLSEKMKESEHEAGLQKKFCGCWPEIKSTLQSLQGFSGEPKCNERFLQIMNRQISVKGKTYLYIIQSLDKSQAAAGTEWLESIIMGVVNRISQLLPLLQEG